MESKQSYRCQLEWWELKYLGGKASLDYHLDRNRLPPYCCFLLIVSVSSIPVTTTFVVRTNHLLLVRGYIRIFSLGSQKDVGGGWM